MHAPGFWLQQHVKPSLYFCVKDEEMTGLLGCSSKAQFIALSYGDVSLSLNDSLFL